jgi:hypothetical protein
LEFNKVTLVLFTRREITVTGLVTFTFPETTKSTLHFFQPNRWSDLPLPIADVTGASCDVDESRTLLEPTGMV